ncbi:hypothetical protein SAY86_018312 [Trapa natans]|uniref:RING-type domain-containing protein n=1 Tax=Trapa natans TaxID=22666 RepID=A0AAN7LGN6_TRANT|nr:hypothetical protein SAY86_018312 [Trapa natans]
MSNFCDRPHISMAASVLQSDAERLLDGLNGLSISRQGEGSSRKTLGTDHGSSWGVCAICLNAIELQETALVKGCEHAYCVKCILRWASYKDKAICPQCKLPFEFLHLHRTLDGRICDYMFEESVPLLLRAYWFEPLVVQDHEEKFDDHEDYYPYDYEYEYEYENEDDNLDEAYYHSSSIRIGNRRWGDNGYVRAGHQEARPILRPNSQDAAASTSSLPRQSKKEAASAAKEATGRRAKRARKRQAADKAAESQAAHKHQQHLMRLGRK